MRLHETVSPSGRTSGELLHLLLGWLARWTRGERIWSASSFNDLHRLPNPSPGVQPGAKGPQGSVIRGHGDTQSEADSSTQKKMAAWVEHRLLDHVVRRCSRVCGIVSPSVGGLRLITNSNLVAVLIGKVDGFAPAGSGR